MDAMRRNAHQERGQTNSAAKYLGNITTWNGEIKENVRRRMQVTKAVSRMWLGLWG